MLLQGENMRLRITSGKNDVPLFEADIGDDDTIHLDQFEGAGEEEYCITEEDRGLTIFPGRREKQVLLSPQDDGMILLHVLRNG